MAKKKTKKGSSNALDPVADFDAPVKREPKQKRIPGMEDNAIQDLEEAAIAHVELRSEIVKVRDQLHESETRLASLLKANGKTVYRRDGIRLKLRKSRESVSVQVKRHDEEE